MNEFSVQNHVEFLSTIAAENAALKVKIKQEYDNACAIINSINKVETGIETCSKDIEKFDGLYAGKSSELRRLEEDLQNAYTSHQRIQSNIDNLKKQCEWMEIEQKQKQKERDAVRAHYEKMIMNQQEINNSFPLVLKKNKLENKVEALLIQRALLKTAIQETNRKKSQLLEITYARFRYAIVELASVYVESKKRQEKRDRLFTLLKENKTSLTELKEQHAKQQIAKKMANVNNIALPKGSSVPMNWNTRTKRPTIPSVSPVDLSRLMKHLQHVDSMKNTRSPFVLPPLLSRSVIPKSSYLKASNSKLMSPVEKKSNLVLHDSVKRSVSDAIAEKTENKICSVEKQDTSVDSSKIVGDSAVAISVDDGNVDVETISDPVHSDVTERICKIDLNRVEHPSPKSNYSSSGSVKGSPNHCQKESSVSPRSRIPILVGKSPHPSESSRIRHSPSPRCMAASPKCVVSSTKSVQKRDFASSNKPVKRYKDADTVTKLANEINSQYSEVDAGGVKRNQKFPKMDQTFLQRLKSLPSKVKTTAMVPERVSDATRKPNFESHLSSRKLAKNVSYKRSVLDEMNQSKAIMKTKIVGEKGTKISQSNLKRQYPNDVEKFKHAMIKKQNSELSARSDLCKDERAEKQPIQPRRNMKPMRQEKNVRRVVDVNRFPEISLEDLMKQTDTLKTVPKADVLKNFQDELMKLKEIRSAVGRGDGVYNEVEIESKRVGAEGEHIELKGIGRKLDVGKDADENRSKYFANEERFDEDENHAAMSRDQESYDKNFQSRKENVDECDVDRNSSTDAEKVSLTSHQNDDPFVTPDLSNFVASPSPPSTCGMFAFGSSVNQIFGFNDEATPNEAHKQNGGGFPFNFSFESDEQPFKLF